MLLVSRPFRAAIAVMTFALGIRVGVLVGDPALADRGGDMRDRRFVLLSAWSASSSTEQRVDDDAGR